LSSLSGISKHAHSRRGLLSD